MPASEEIRLSTPQDLPEIKLLLQECFPNRKVIVPETECLLLRQVACVFYSIVSDECEIIDICVKPENRRSGAASKLLVEVFRRAKEEGAQKFFLEVESTNTPAIQLYMKHGFTKVGIRKGYYRYNDGSTGDAMLMGMSNLECLL